MSGLWIPPQAAQSGSVRVENGFLVIEGAAMVRAHSIISVKAVPASQYSKPSVTIQHGGKSLSNPTISIECLTFEEARRLYDTIAVALTTSKRGKP